MSLPGEIVPATLQDALRRAAELGPDRGLTFVHDANRRTRVTYAELLEQARRTASWLIERGVQPRDPVVLSLSGNEPFVRAFWGCVFAGAVPAPVPHAGRGGVARERIDAVRRALRHPLVISDLPDAIASTPSVELSAAPVDTAVIQFSSGTTGIPRGVVLTHDNVISNIRDIAGAIHVSPHDVGVSWTPLHHDLALIGFLLGSTWAPNDLVLIDTAAFVRRPALWLDVLDEYGGTITAAPDFGQRLTLSRMTDGAWNLSRVRVLFNGAEPIAPSVMHAFMRALAPHGLRASAMFPVYGLAEATLAVCFPPSADGPTVSCFDRRTLHPGDRARAVEANAAAAVALVGEGRPIGQSELRLVDDSDAVVDEGIVGHVQVRGPGVTPGYYNDAEATSAAFCEGWLRTGDLAVRHDGAVYITGRSKDVLFINGQNLYAADIEQAARQAPGGEDRIVAATAWRGDGEAGDRLLLFVSSSDVDADAALLAAISQSVLDRFAIHPYALVPIRRSDFPRTTSGKLQRFRLRERYEAGEYASAAAAAARAIGELRAGAATPADAPPTTATERIVHAVWARELGIDPGDLGVHDRFEQTGGTSLNALTIALELEARFGIVLAHSTVIEHRTVAALATCIDTLTARGPVPAPRRVAFRG